MENKAKRIIEILQGAGFQAFLVGGCVRDSLLGKTPKDFDVASNATPEQVEGLFPSTLPLGKAFGVVVVMMEGEPFEVATFRQDFGSADGRRPDKVTFSSIEEDVKRRDLTINGLFFDPIKDKVVDLVGGIDDLNRKMIRFIGDPSHRIKEDKLRMLRAIRFATVLDFNLSPVAFEAIKSQATGVTQVSFERITLELKKILCSQNPGKGLRLLEETGLLKVILPEITFNNQMADCKGLPFEVSLALLLKGLDTPLVEGVLRRLKLTTATMKAVVRMLGQVEQFSFNLSLADKKRLIRQEGIENLFLFGKVFFASNLDILKRIEELEQWSLTVDKGVLTPKPLLTGKDLQDCGLKPSPQFARILHQLEDLQLMERIETKDQAMQWLQGFIA